MFFKRKVKTNNIDFIPDKSYSITQSAVCKMSDVIYGNIKNLEVFVTIKE